MSSFIFGFIMGAVCMFFAIGWLRLRMVEQAEPLDDLSLLAGFDDDQEDIAA